MTKSTHLPTFIKFIIFICLIALTYSISKPGNVQKQPVQSAKTVVEVNRFYSVEYKQANYNISSMTVGKSLILTLMRTNKIAQIIKQGLTITFSGGEEQIICPFKKITDLCVVPDIPEDLKMVIKCENLPCQVQWKIYQPTALGTETKQSALNLYNLENTTHHLMGQIYCNDPKITTLYEDVTIYSQTPYIPVYYNNVVYVLFSSFSKGYVYVDVAEASRNCAFISFTNVPHQVKLNQEDYITDFVSRQSNTIYELAELPKTDFSIQCQATRLDVFNNIKSTMQVTLMGTKNGVKQQIIVQKIKSIARSKEDDFTYIFKAPALQYTKIQFQLNVDNSQIYLINFRVIANNHFVVQLGQTIYLNLLKGQKITLKIEGDNDISQASQTYYLLQKRKPDLKLSSNTCDAVTGCTVQVQALVDTDNLIYISSSNASSTVINQDGKGSYQFQQIQFIHIEKQIKHKIRMGQNLFFKKKVKLENTYQVHVNSPNVILYAASKSKCVVPDVQCRERTGNFHHPFVYEASQEDELLINVEGLDNTQFQLTILQDNKIMSLTDGTAFSYSMDEGEERIDFTFKLQEKSDVSFNLISPLNALRLYVANQIKSGQEMQAYEQSTDGYIQFQKDDIKGLDFTLSIQKINSKQKYFSHFTLIASSAKAHIRLQPSVTTYQTLSVGKYRQFIFEFDKSESCILSLSIFNLKKQQINLLLQYSKDDKWDNAHSVKIQKQVDFIQLSDVSAILCSEQGEDQCQIFLRITNNMKVQADLTLTLIQKNSVLQLKDGIWQAFPSSQLTTTSSYYFYPRHLNNNILIFYHSSMSNAHVSYRLWRYDVDDINPEQWPFPFIVDPEQRLHDKFKKNNYISIDHEQMSKLCWPNCVVLLNVYLQVQENAPSSLYQYSLFKVMASNSQVELPEKHKGTFTLGKQEDKQILIDLKYPLTKNSITFYSTSTIGQCTINANVYSQKQQKCPIVNQASDFPIAWGQHELQISKIKEAIKTKDMEQDKNIYLCVGIHSQTNCKITLQYTSQDDIYKQFHADAFEDIQLGANQTKLFELDGMIEQYSKLTRLSGFPFVVIKRCQSKENLQECKAEFANSTEKGTQIVAKTESLSQQSCPTCTFLVKLSTFEPSQLRFHSQTKFSQIQLKQKVTISDFLNQNEENKYQIHANREQDLIINIHVQEGDIEAKLTDASLVNLVKKSTTQKRVVQFIIKGQKEVKGDKKIVDHQIDDVDQDAGLGLINPLALSNTFIVYHLTISSQIKEKASTFSIGYSSGARQFFLQDGLIVDYQLESNKLHTFFYCNQNAKDHILYTISSRSPQTLKKLKIVISYFQDIGNKQSKKQFIFQKPAFNKKNPNPSLVIQFPSYNCFSIDLTNPSPKTELFSMGINHQQVVFLPFNHEYPFLLHKLQYLNILTDVNIPGFIQLQIKKCDQSTPTIAYTFDYDGFIKGEYLYEAALTEQSSFKYHIKAYRIGTLYIKIQTNPEQSSTASIKLLFSQQKMKTVSINAGNHGVLNYQFISATSANITFQPVQCSECKNVKYFAVSSDDQDNLYQQLVCPNAYFKVTKAANKVPIVVHANQNPISFTYTMETGVSFVGVLASIPSGQEVYYRPIQISTLWAKWGQASTTHQVLMTLLVLMALCIVIVWVRRLSRKGYQPLEELPQ